MRPPAFLEHLAGPPPSLPRALDLLSDRFWGLGPRSRLGVVALVTVTVVVIGTAALARAGWGQAEQVTVAARALPAGHEVTADDLRTVAWPEELVPPDAATAPIEGTLVSALPEGAPLAEAHLGAGGHGGLVAESHAAVALPLDLVAEHTLGARLDVVASDGHGTATILATRARVVATDDEHLWLEVDHDDAADVAAAGRDRSATVIVHPP